METISIAGFFNWPAWLTAVRLTEGRPMRSLIFRILLLVGGSLVLSGCERSSPFGKPEQPVKSAVEVVAST